VPAWAVCGLRSRRHSRGIPRGGALADHAELADGTVPLGFFLRDQDKNQFMMVQDYPQP
jgi:hypothetical protein